MIFLFLPKEYIFYERKAKIMGMDLERSLSIPSGTKFEERTIVSPSDVVIGNYATLDYGLIGNLIICGEHVKINGNLKAQNVKIDNLSSIGGDIDVENDAYFGEFVHISGKLRVGGDLDIGNDVRIDGGFEAKGWIVIRNPVPSIIFLLMYILALLRMGKSEAIEEAFKKEEEISLSNPLIIPARAHLSNGLIKTIKQVKIGDDCRILGNIRGSKVMVGERTTIFGSIRSGGNVNIGKGSIIHGDLVSRSTVVLEREARVLGQVVARRIKICDSAEVDGVLRASADITILREKN